MGCGFPDCSTSRSVPPGSVELLGACAAQELSPHRGKAADVRIVDALGQGQGQLANRLPFVWPVGGFKRLGEQAGHGGGILGVQRHASHRLEHLISAAHVWLGCGGSINMMPRSCSFR
jgi:hypothetical protein